MRIGNNNDSSLVSNGAEMVCLLFRCVTPAIHQDYVFLCFNGYGYKTCGGSYIYTACMVTFKWFKAAVGVVVAVAVAVVVAEAVKKSLP
jgi:hypothetical protein